MILATFGLSILLLSLVLGFRYFRISHITGHKGVSLRIHINKCERNRLSVLPATFFSRTPQVVKSDERSGSII